MAIFHPGFLLVCTIFILASGLPKNLPTLLFREGFLELFVGANLVTNNNSALVRISLDERTGSGFVSKDLYLHGVFSASIKLPAGYTAGVVVTFYMSNSEIHKSDHDEIDFEFLGNVRGKSWVVQTNFYGNGSTNRGREERYDVWFDPSGDFHRYSIVWAEDWIIFYVDNVPIREVQRFKAMGGDFPSKPMSLYATIWDGSSWATSGGKQKVNYQYAPFFAQYSDVVLDGCSVDPTRQAPKCDNATSFGEILRGNLSAKQRNTMRNFRMKYMTYSYCQHPARYTTPLPECGTDPREAEHLRRIDPFTYGARRP